MKNNKGFTLVEVLAVVAILVTIIVIVTPKIFKQFKTAEEVTDKEQINTLINTAKLYMNQNSNLLPQENDIYVIQMQELKDSGLIKTNQILNPSTKEELNGCIIVKYENNKYKYEYKEELEQITVTFDPQGGTLQETSKNVITGEKYGTLPTPTRDGYTFMGWNGKNMFTGLNKGIAIRILTGEETASDTWASSDFIIVDFNNNNYYLNGLMNTLFSRISFYNENKQFMGASYSNARNSISLKGESNIRENKTDIEGDIRYIRVAQYEVSLDGMGTIDDIDNLQIQLEEGDTATPYEPYYITPSTTVVQSSNHTLKAIWQANS